MAVKLRQIHFKYLVKIWFRLILSRVIALLSLLFFISSCSDQGCIEADDFGEYATQTLTISSNVNSNNCNYDSTLDLTDPSQGSGLKDCFTRGAPTIIDENGNSPVFSAPNTKGCSGLQDPTIVNAPLFKQLCVDYCVASCIEGASTGGSTSEPPWQVTASDGTMVISPLSSVLINVTGNVVLGNSLNLPSAYVGDALYGLQSSNINWDNTVIDVKNGQTRKVTFSGKWANGAGKIFGDSSNWADIANGARSLAAYVVAAPAGYDFDYSQSSETAGAKGVPLFADSNAWKCSYTGSTNLQSNCLSGDYDAVNGYTSAIDNVATLSLYNITSSKKADNIGSIGGMIRWDNDGLNDTAYDPFSANNCDSGDCGIITVAPNFGQILGDLAAADLSISNSNNFAVAVAFKPLLTGNSCNFNLSVAVLDSDNTQLYSHSITLDRSKWSNTGADAIKVSLEAGHKLKITHNSTNYTTTGSTVKNCGTAIAMKFLPYQDILMAKSGLVSFKILGGATGVVSGSCSIVGRVINPAGSHVDQNVNFTSDFYEYGNFNSSADPLNNLSVVAASNSSHSWSNKIFVRKGQIIRFAPESWLGTWNSEAGPRKCGIGMAINIEERPALLCRGFNSDAIPNPSCTQDFSTGVLTGCLATSSDCNTDPAALCNAVSCQPAISCTDGTVDNFYQKTSCSVTPLSSADFNTQCSGVTGMTSGTCNECGNRKLANAQKAAMISQNNLIQCYDLENYTGKVANIAVTTGFAIDNDGKLIDDPNTKGALKLSGFNGVYGNFANYALSPNDPPDAVNHNVTYGLTSPLIFTQTGRLKFLILSGNDFTNITTTNYSGNAPLGSAYTGDNGYKISFGGQLNFSNGDWLEVILCQEVDSGPAVCNRVSRPPALTDGSNIARVVELDDATASTILQPTTKTSFNFDEFGNILRINNASDSPQPDNDLVAIGSDYYVHNYLGLSSADLANLTDSQKKKIKRLRLSFKIKDPEIFNCSTNGGANNGILLINPAYSAKSNCSTSDPISTPNGVRDFQDPRSDSYSHCHLNSGFTGATCGDDESPTTTEDLPSGKTQCLKQFYCGNRYANNTGEYYVTVRIKDPNNTISNIVSSVIEPVITVMDGSKDGTQIGQAQLIYSMIISDGRYQAILSMCLVLMFTFYGVGYLMGVSELTHSELMIRVIKIGVIYLFVGPTGWYWFNLIIVKFFKQGTDYVAFLMATSFDNSPKIAGALASGDYYDKSILFSSVDDVFGMFFSRAVQAKVSALLFASIFGFLYLYIIYLSFFLYVYAVANAVLLYLTAQVFISILFILGPIFFIFPLFNQTKNMFDNWIKALIGFSLQQIFLLTTLAFFNMMMYEVIKMSLGYKVCWDDVWVINIITRIKLLSFWTIASLPPRTNPQSEVGNVGNSEGIPSLFSILYIWIIASLMNKFVGFMTDLASSIGGGIKASSIADGLKTAAKELKSAAMQSDYLPFKHINQAVRGAINEKINKLDDKLFDSGKVADDRRRQQKAQDKQDSANKASLRKAGKEGESAFKKEYGADHAKALDAINKDASLSAEQKLAKKDEVQKKFADKMSAKKDEAISKQGKKLGLSAEEIQKLKEDKGFKYRGSNVFGAGIAAIRQYASGDMKAVADDKLNTAITHAESKAIMKDTDAEGRKAITEVVKSGDIKVEKSKAEKAGDAAKTVAKATKIAAQATIALPVAATITSAVVGGAYIGIKGGIDRALGNKNAFKQAKDQVLNSKLVDNPLVKGAAVNTKKAVIATAEATISASKTVVKGVEAVSRGAAGVVAGGAGLALGGLAVAATSVATTTTAIAGGIATATSGAVGTGVGIVGGVMGGVVGTGRGLVEGIKNFKTSMNIPAAIADGIGTGAKKGFKTGFDKFGGAGSIKIAKATAKLATEISKPGASFLDSNFVQKPINFSKKQLQKSSDIINSSDYDKTAKNLEKQGLIDRFVPGTAALGRSDKDKKLIKDQMKQDKQEREVKQPDSSSIKTAADLQKRAEVEDALSRPEANHDLGIRATDTLSAKIFGREKFGSRKYSSDAIKDVKQSRREAFEQSTEDQLKSAESRQGVIQSNIDKFTADREQIRQHPAMQAMQQMRAGLDAAKTPEAKRAAQSRIDDYSKNPEYKKQDALDKGASVAIQQLEIKQDNNDQKIKQLKKAASAIERVQAVNKGIKDLTEPQSASEDQDQGYKLTGPEIESAQNQYQNLDGSAEAYEKYADKYENNQFNKDRRRIVPRADEDDTVI